MELTLDQALQQGMAAHREGKLQDAKRFYHAILQTQPNHADANHNLGVLVVSVGKHLDAVPLFKRALEANPQIEQFWLSYIDILITVGHFDEAQRVLAEGESSGVAAERLDALNQRLQGCVPSDSNKTASGQTLSEKRKKLAAKKKRKKRKAGGDPSSTEPSQNQLNHLLEVYQAGIWEEAEALAASLTKQFPKHPFGWRVLGALFQQTGRLTEALATTQSAVKLFPQDAAVHNNLGVTLQEVGRLSEAETSGRRAIALKPDYAEAHNNLGVTLQELGRLDEAEASCRQAIALKPGFAKAHNNLGITLKKLGRLNEAEASYKQAILLKPDYAEAHNNLGATLQKLGKLEEAAESYAQALALNPENSLAKHHLAALSGDTTESAPLDYVEKLFDKYALTFDRALVDELEYKTPKLIAEIILRDSDSDSLGSIIDLGCGTGLLGAEIKQFCERLEGLDLSQKMLDEAKEKRIYDELIKQDILGYLANADLNFDYFIATDVFVYVGDLSDVFHLIKSRNKTGGKLVFSTEHYHGDGFLLQQSGRYSHSKTYIERLSEKFAYQLRHFETQPLRKESNQYITGGLYILDF